MSAINDVNDKKVDLNDVLDNFGIFDRYHIQMFILTFLAFTSNVMYCTNYVFAAEEVSYRCKDDVENDFYCSAFNSTHVCSEWVYDNPDSFVAYFQLACHEWKRTLVGTVHNFGYMCGLLIVGPMSDRLGRKTAVVITGIFGAVFGILRSFSSWYWFYIAMEFMEAIIGDTYSPMFVLTLEIVSTKKKVLYLMICSFGVAFGGVLLPIAAWLTPDWRSFLRVIYAPSFLFIIYKYLLDESPRWLLAKGRRDEAVLILEKAAKKNIIDIDKNVLENLSCEVSENVRLAELLKETFRSKTLRQRFFICLIWWTTCSFVSFGLRINSVSLQGNKYVNNGLSGLVDLPATIATTYTMMYFRRKIPLVLSFFVVAILCISQPFLPLNLQWLSITFYMAGKLMGTSSFLITYLYTLELFPTYTRNSMHALCSSLGRVGAIVAPQTPLLMVYWSGLPSFVFGLAALIAGLVTFLVPDLYDDSLPDTIHQAEALGKTKMTGVTNEIYDSRL